MRLNTLIRKAQDLIIEGRKAKTTREKDEALDGLWELIINIEFELRHGQKPSLN